MSKLKFKFSIFGGPAGKHRVDLDTLSKLLFGVSQDVRDVCRNIAHSDKGASWEDKLASCRLYMTAEPEPGSLTMRCETEASDLVWGERSMLAYADGLAALRFLQGDEDLPDGLSYPILNRINGYYGSLAPDYDGFSIEIDKDGGSRSIRFDEGLRAAVEGQLGRFKRTQHWLYGYTIQGVLYEVSDQHYDDPSSEIKVEVDPHDGTRWVCYVPKTLIREPLDSYFRKTVVMEGDAKFKPRKPEMHASTLRVLEAMSFDDALRRFLESGKGVWDDVNPSEHMRRVRERD